MAIMIPILCLNGGSSSLKWALYQDETRLAHGEEVRSADLQDRVAAVFNALPHCPAAVGHRLVHGGLRYVDPVLITDSVRRDLEKLCPLAPLHLPMALALIDAVTDQFPHLPQVGCFDTAFHRNLLDSARLFPLPQHVRDMGVVRYGFHGLSFESIIDQLGRELPARLVIAHLGNGVSLAAILNGRCVDTTMGFTPTGGLMMGTRSGDLDPGILIYLLKQGYDVDALSRLVNDESGLLGVSGLSADMKLLLQLPAGDEAISLFCYQVRKGIGAMSAVLGGIDRLVFTGGIGEQAALIREKICHGLEYLAIETIQTLHTDEDRMIARHTSKVIT